MAKAINWPKVFEPIIRDEGTLQVFCALRPGRLYYDNRYWVDGEVVDIRADQNIVRQGVVIGDLKCCAIRELTPDDLTKHKPGLQNVDAIVRHLSERYSNAFDPSDEVTVVYYKNLELEKED